MKKYLLGLALVLVLGVSSAFAGGPMIYGDGRLTIQTLEQVEGFPLPLGNQLFSEWIQLRGVIGLGIRFCPVTGVLTFCGEKETKDGGVERMYLSFKSAGLVARYNWNKKTELLTNGHVIFNGEGRFWFVDVDPDGEETLKPEAYQVEDGTYEHGKAITSGKITFGRNGIGTLQGVTIQGGNLGFLWRGILGGKVSLVEEID